MTENKPNLIYGCTTCQNVIEINPESEIPKPECCENPDYYVSIMGNDGHKHRYTLGEFLSMERAKWIRLNEKREYVLNIFEENNKIDISSEDELKQKVIELIEDQRKPESYFLIARFFITNHSLITFKDTEEIFVYNNGVYERHGDKFVAQECQRILKEIANTHFINEVLGHIRRTTFKSREKLAEPENKVCLENGILDLNELVVENHNPDLIFFNKLPVNYMPTAECLKIKKFISEVVNSDSIQTIQEIFGYCVYKKYFIHKAFMFVGNGANGKSTLLNLLKNFLGSKNVTAIPLQSLENNRFALAQLHGRLANIFADLSAKALRDTSLFKMLVGEDLIPAEKKFKDGFNFLNYSKQLFSANQIPKSPEDTDAFFRRWIIVNFPNQFIDKADKKLLDRLTSSEELSGLLNWAIEGLKRLQTKGDFTNSGSISQVRNTYIRMSDSVKAFYMDCVIINPERHIAKKEVYTSYADYCRQMSYPIVAENTFHRNLQQEVRVEDYRPLLEIEGKKIRVQCWKGIEVDFRKVKNPDKTDTVDIKNADIKEIVNTVNDVNVVSLIKTEKKEIKINNYPAVYSVNISGIDFIGVR